MNILTINTGSSSIRLALFLRDKNGLRRISNCQYKTGEGLPAEQLKSFLKDNLLKVSIVAHRIVHGGTKFITSCVINENVESEIEKLYSLAPLHNPIALKWIRVCKDLLPSTPQVAVFDTAFYASLPEVARIYALPKDLCNTHGIRRYGFHGIAHRAMLQRWLGLRPDLKEGGKVISLQLGAGCSITAVNRSNPVDTSMGFSPLEGLVMATRSGDIDPGVVIYLQKEAGLAAEEIDRLLNKSSGLMGVSGISGDMRVLLESDEPAARLAVNLYCYSAKKYIGAYMAALGGAEAILFGGGVGENSPVIRGKIIENMLWCGVELDNNTNTDTIGKEERISSADSKVDIWVIPVDEGSVLAGEATEIII